MTSVRAKQWEQAAILLDSGTALSISSALPGREAKFYNLKGTYFYYQGQLDSSSFYYERALDIARQEGDSSRIASRLRNLGLNYRQKGLPNKALMYYDEALQIAGRGENQSLIANLNNAIALLYQGLNEHEKSLDYLSVANQIWRNQKNMRGVATILNNMGNAYYAMGRAERALREYHESLQLSDSLGLRTDNALKNIGEVLIDLNRLHEAETYLNRALDEREKAGDIRGRASVRNQFGLLLIKRGNYALGQSMLKKAVEDATAADDRRLLIENHAFQKRLFIQWKKPDLALTADYIYDSLSNLLFEDEKLKVQELQASLDLSQANEKLSQTENARQQQERNARNNMAIAIIMGVFLSTTLYFLITLYRQRKKLDQMNSLLEVQNEKINALNRQNFHFTKNSLTEIVSLIGLQARKLEDGGVKDSLMAEKLRIESVNLLYRQLFDDSSAGGGEKVLMQPLISGIVINTLDALLPLNHNVQTVLEIEEIELPNDKSLSIALILNELCINACKYVYRKGEGHLFSVSMSLAEDKILLKVQDDGPGLKPEIDFNTTDSFGMQLIRLLGQDLSAKINVESTDSGLSYYFEIPN